jgi:hypothetical protein
MTDSDRARLDTLEATLEHVITAFERRLLWLEDRCHKPLSQLERSQIKRMKEDEEAAAESWRRKEIAYHVAAAKAELTGSRKPFDD